MLSDRSSILLISTKRNEDAGKGLLFMTAIFCRGFFVGFLIFPLAKVADIVYNQSER